MSLKHCRICGCEGDFPVYSANEMQCGIGGSFEYFMCSGCGCLQIAGIPDNIAGYYTNDYIPHAKASGFAGFLSRIKTRAVKSRYSGKKFDIPGMLARIIAFEFLSPIDDCKNIMDKKILDVGCGDGKLIRTLREIGFKHVLGTDPFIPDDIYDHNNELLVKKTEFNDIDDKFDIIIFQHSLEHMPDNIGALKHAAGCLSDGGVCIVTIPTVSSFAWGKYKENWFSLDAPRHFFLHSLKSIDITAQKAGFTVSDIKYRSTHCQITRSGYYAKGIYADSVQKKLSSPIGILKTAVNSIRARRLNKRKQGDVITVYMSLN